MKKDGTLNEDKKMFAASSAVAVVAVTAFAYFALQISVWQTAAAAVVLSGIMYGIGRASYGKDR